MNHHIFCCIDPQFDFISPAGALAVPGALKCVPNIQKLVSMAASRSPHDLFIGSLDTHDWRASEFIQNGGDFPSHCLKGTLGWCPIDGMMPSRTVIVPHGTTSRVVPGASAYYFEKSEISLLGEYYDGSPMQQIFESWEEQEGDINALDAMVYVWGVALDYCVLEATKGFLELGHRVTVVTDATAAVTEIGKTRTIEWLVNWGVYLALTSEILALFSPPVRL